MPRLIDRNGPIEDRWTAVGADDPLPADAVDVIVPLARWLDGHDALVARAGHIGVQLQPDDDPFALAGRLDGLSLVAVAFPKFTDGRGRSTARLLRDERIGWRGELRATGDVLRDQLFHLARLGFDTYALRDDQDVAVALTAFKDFSEVYQASTDRRGLFERRPLAGSTAHG